MPLELFLDDIVELRKPHPCGSVQWRLVRLGADIGLKCLGCERRVLLPRRILEKRLKRFVSRGVPSPTPHAAPSPERATAALPPSPPRER